MTTHRNSATQRTRRRTRARIGRPPGQTADQTRQRILLAARECFAQVGFERATNRDIAAAAGVTAAAIYRHFESKPELYVAVVQDALAEHVPRMRAAVTSPSGARAGLRDLLRAADQTRSQIAHFLAAVPIEMHRHPEVAKLMLADPGEVFTIVTEFVANGVRSKEIHPDKQERVISMIIATMMGLGMYANVLGDAAGKQAAAGFVDLLDDVLFNRDGD